MLIRVPVPAERSPASPLGDAQARQRAPLHTHALPLALGVAGLLLLGVTAAAPLQEAPLAVLALAALAGGLIAGSLALVLLQRQAGRQHAALREHTQALQAHQRNAQLLDAIAQCSPDAIYAKDLQGRYLYFNRAAAALCGREPHELIGRDDAFIFSPDEVAQIQAVDRQVLASGEVTSYEVDRPTAVGVRSFHATKGPLRDAQGQVIGSFGFSHDITQRRQSEEQLRQLQQAVEQSSESIVIADLQARIIYVNAATLASSGYTRQELLGANLRLLQSGRTPHQTYVDMWGALASGLPWKGLLFNRRKDGSEYVEFAAMTPVRTPQGRITHFIAVKEDVTEKQRMGAELDAYRSHLEDLVGQRTAELAQAKRVAEAANAAKSSFLATMSHEIRTPMNGIVGLVEVLQASPLSSEQGELLRSVRDSAFALLKILDGLLDFSKIEAGCLVLEHARVDLRALCEGACDALKASATDRELLLKVFVDPALPSAVMTDALRMQQIINNLVGNAIKFSAGLTRPGRVSLRVDSPGTGLLRLSVADNGIGMDAAALARVFDPFVQAEDSTTRRYGGTGLGLSIVQKLVQAFGGSIEAHSVPDQGSRFVVQMPLLPAPATPDPDGTIELPQVDCHLLLGDDGLEQDWSKYLQATGAGVYVWPDAATLRAGLYVEPSADGVLLLGDALPPAAQADARQLAEASGVGLVRVGRGTRRKPYRDAAGDLRIDIDALHRDTLLLAVAISAGRGSPSWPADGERTTVPVGLLGEPLPARGQRVLVAEDNPVNQTVIRMQLSLLGLESDVAADGLQALDMWRSGRYAMLLTDLHMPGLDGCTLVERIRAEASGPVRAPMIAVTASASDDDRARCRAAGMDDTLGKPIVIERLAELLRRWLPGTVAASAAPGDTAEVAGDAVLDEGALPKLVGPDPVVLQRIRREYLDASQGSADALREAVARGRWADARAVAHRLKSSSRAVGAMQLASLCAAIEDAVRRDEPALLRPLQARFDQAMAEVQRRMQASLPAAAEAEPAARAGSVRRYVPRELSDALEHDQLRVVYQPQVSLKDGRLLALEALVRWQHPSDGLVLPEHFLALAEERGLIDDLLMQVMDKALGQVRRWRDQGVTPTLAVNLSGYNLRRPDLADALLALLARHGVDASKCRLELSEASLPQLTPAARDTLGRLRKLGFGLAVDDFGSGHASLSDLRALPFDQLKIDPGLVHGCSQCTARRATLKASLAMARQCGLQAVAEGVEDAADWDTVRDAGCDAAQGYFVGRPIAADLLPGWITGFRKRYPQIA